MTATTYVTQTGAVVAGTATIDAAGTTTEAIVLDSKQNLALVVPDLTSEGSQTSNQTMLSFLGQAFDGGDFEKVADEQGRVLFVQVVAGEIAPVPDVVAAFYAIKIVANVAQDVERAIAFVASSPGAAGGSASIGGGALPFSYISLGTGDDAKVVKASAGQIYGGWLTNVNAAPAYVKFYDKATAPTTADTPVQRLLVPGNAAGAGGILPMPVGLSFTAGISFRIVTGVADNDSTDVAANEVLVNLGYK